MRIYRVTYGKKEIAEQDREYQIDKEGPVGTLEDYKEMSKGEKLEVFEKCPNCGKFYSGYPAVSRKDNKTEICSACGTVEAIKAMEDYMKQKGD